MTTPTNNLQTFLWEGVSSQGQAVKGTQEATSAQLVYVELKRRGIMPTKVTKKTESLLSFRKPKVKSLDIVVFSRHLATMLAAGIPLVKSLELIGSSTENTAVQELVNALKLDVESGHTLYQALVKYPRYFDGLFCNLVKAGEQSGTLSVILGRIATHLEKTESLKKKVKKALFYPITVVTVAILITVLMMVFVIPKFQLLFSNYGKKLPAFTQLVINLSSFIRSYGWLVLALFIIVGILVRKSYRTNPQFHEKVDRFVLKIIIIGPILVKAIIARITRTLSTTISAGIPIIDAIAASKEIAGNDVYAKALSQISEKVATGEQLHVAMGNFPVFPKLVVQMIAVGEETGAIEQMLSKVATYYEEDVDAAVDGLSSLLEPIIMIILGVLIGGLVIAMYLPIFKLASVF